MIFVFHHGGMFKNSVDENMIYEHDKVTLSSLGGLLISISWSLVSWQ